MLCVDYGRLVVVCDCFLFVFVGLLLVFIWNACCWYSFWLLWLRFPGDLI